MLYNSIPHLLSLPASTMLRKLSLFLQIGRSHVPSPKSQKNPQIRWKPGAPSLCDQNLMLSPPPPNASCKKAMGSVGSSLLVLSTLALVKCKALVHAWR